MHATTRPLARLPRLTMLAAASALMGGCAALQIDVDVYKGPLVHDEETQVQQLASIAMSGKAVMLIQRNSWLNKIKPDWSDTAAAAKGLRARYIKAGEWELLQLKDKCTDDVLGQCRNARLINDMLSAYEDRTESALATELEAVGDTYQAYKRARDSFRSASSSEEKDKQLKEANLALNSTWGALVDLLQAVKLTQSDPDNQAVLRATERQSAELLARMTEVAFLACAPGLQLSPELTEVVAWVKDKGASLPAETIAKVGSDQLSLALRAAQAGSLPALRTAATKILDLDDAGRCTPAGSSAILRPQNQPKGFMQSLPPPSSAPISGALRKPSAPRQGVQREATSANDTVLDADLRDIDEMVNALMQFGASGFDRGRPRWGLDRLADLAATSRFDVRARGKDGVKTLTDSKEAKQLHDSVVDLASRMQFLAVNMRLIDGTASETELAFKSTLETIANTLLVLTEDQRRQRQHRERQQHSADEEYAAAVDAFRLDSGLRFDQLTSSLSTRLATVRDKENKDTAHTEKLTRQTAAQTAALAALKAAEETAANRSAPPQQLLALLVTLDGETPKNLVNLSDGTKATVMAHSKDAPARWKADKAAVGAALKALPAESTVQGVRDAVANWLDAEFKERDSLANKADARQLRLKAAAAALATFKTAGTREMARTDALKAMRLELAGAWEQQLGAAYDAEQAVSKSRTDLETINEELQSLQQQAKAKRTAEGEALSSAEIDAALKLLRPLRAAVVAEAAASKGAHEVSTIRDLVNAKLQQAKSASAADKQAAHQTALALVAQWGDSQPAVIKPGNRVESRAVDTLDRVEAYLSYARVEATQRGGAAGAGVKETSDALAALMQRRERMSYLRPASMYLRSALATTGQQSDPGLEWRNLLYGVVKRPLSENMPSPEERKTANVRADLDKSFWQNVNQVRVSAGGDSNFAIAKDDVGNWYVKAMGADSGAMISAAKNLALYNLGGRIDTNLLRIDELRNKAQRQPADDTELQDLLDRRNGAAATAYGSTLRVFADNHAKAVKALQASLDETLKTQAHFEQLRARWAKTYADSPAKLEAVKLALSDSAVLSLHDKALTAIAPVDPQPVDTTPSAQLLEALDLVAQQRARIRTLLSQMAVLTSAETAAADALKKVVTEQETLLAAAQTEQAALLQKRLALQEQIDKLTSDKKSEADLLARDRDDKQKQANEKGLEVAELRAKLVAARETSSRLNTVADSAQALKARALDDVDTALNKLVKDTASKQLRAVEEFETAARVVSQGVQGKAAKP